MKPWKGILEAYKEFLPINEGTPMLTLHEGQTPLVPLVKLSDKLGIELYAKVEGANPTGSFKDRGMVLAMAKAKEEGAKTVICASTGNTSAAAAAYGTRAGLRTIIVVPDGKVALGKLAQAVILGADIFSLKGNFDQALKLVRKVSEEGHATLVNSVNPYRIEGQKTAAFEVCDQLGGAPDILAIPVGNAGNITAYWKGFKEYHERFGTGLPEMHGFEAEGAAAIVRNEVIEAPETIATAIRIGNPASWSFAVQAAEESKGVIDSVTDDEILEAYQLLAKYEGLFAEPASCASIAGIIKQRENGIIKAGVKAVAVLTGNGLKDPATAMNTLNIQPVIIENDEKAFLSHLEGSFSR
ncbi:threonine synthase [Pullulanibacillus sp. KACC 23026]|uniref:threonine synthase n=1 Tax=Pullulanibacillus sp. KACC 23026 TaxID=3028315 RepID=UPI0023B0E082|nr:threonine synthase [Pullulanibacillus sp. KACC 23026]WEG10829.1 threonine synthase [Pullulanibacillus sp. KACC 23026]